MGYLNEDNVDDIVLDSADESAILLAALQDVCTEQEYQELVMENAHELALYGLIDDPEMVQEAATIVKHKITKQESLNREQAKAAFRLARKQNSAEWKNYHKHRAQMIEDRQKIFAKYNSKAKSEAKKVITNSKRKSSSMTSVTGRTIDAKLDKKVKELNGK